MATAQEEAKRQADIMLEKLHPLMEQWMKEHKIPTANIGGILLGVALGALAESGMTEDQSVLFVRNVYKQQRSQEHKATKVKK